MIRNKILIILIFLYGDILKFYLNNVSIKIEYSLFLMIAFALLLEFDSVLYVILFSSLHEMGHIAVLYLFKGKAKSITISYYGIGLKHNCDFSNSKMILFLLSGVFVNLLFSIFNIQREINTALFFINILPLYPLDGGRAIKIMIDSIFDLKSSILIFRIITCLAVILLIFLAVYLKNLSLILIVLYIIVYSVCNSFD